MKFKPSAADAFYALAGMLAWCVFWAWLTVPPADGVARADFGVTAAVFIVGNVISALWSMFAGRRVDRQAAFALESIRTGLTNIGREIVNGLARAGAAIVEVIAMTARYLGRSMVALFRAMANMWDRLIRYLNQIFGPIINFLRWLRDNIRQFYRDWVRPIVEAFQLASAVLQLLGRFGVDWARRLDTELRQIVNYITMPFDFLIEKINEALFWINRIVTVDGLLQRVTLLRSLWRDIDHQATFWWVRLHRPATPGQIAAAREDPDELNEVELADDLHQHFESGSGPLSGLIREATLDAGRMAWLVFYSGRHFGDEQPPPAPPPRPIS